MTKSREHKYILDEKGNAVPEPDTLKWARWFENAGKKRILKQTEIEPGVEVSTVFLGLDYNFTEKGEPLIWETMVFGGKYNQYMNRYSTRKEAEVGHKAFVEALKNNQEPK